MKKIAILLIVLISFTVQGQIWIDEGATWHYDWSGLLPGLDKIEYVGDTIIQDKTCQKLQISRYMFAPIGSGGEVINSWISYKYTYSNGDTVFNLINDDFHVLYNFGAQVGDIWELGVDTNELYCGPSSVEVTATGSTEINGQNCEWIQVTTLPNSSVGIDGRIYKRFGVTSDYLFPTLRNCDPSMIIEFYDFNFTCFEDNSFPLYNVTDKDCDYLFYVGDAEIESAEKMVTVFPNPASDNLFVNIEGANRTLKNLIVTDMQGRLLKNVCQNNVDIADLPKGLYFIHVSFDNDSKIVKRFIKN